ncbi:hypothetical protein BS78_03G021600 [Paspalum vaginatum]|nr:hypothetical protein BS78_03G021600 [Paspalum vaginatum]
MGHGRPLLPSPTRPARQAARAVPVRFKLPPGPGSRRLRGPLEDYDTSGRGVTMPRARSRRALWFGEPAPFSDPRAACRDDGSATVQRRCCWAYAGRCMAKWNRWIQPLLRAVDSSSLDYDGSTHRRRGDWESRAPQLLSAAHASASADR